MASSHTKKMIPPTVKIDQEEKPLVWELNPKPSRLRGVEFCVFPLDIQPEVKNTILSLRKKDAVRKYFVPEHDLKRLDEINEYTYTLCEDEKMEEFCVQYRRDKSDLTVMSTPQVLSLISNLASTEFPFHLRVGLKSRNMLVIDAFPASHVHLQHVYENDALYTPCIDAKGAKVVGGDYVSLGFEQAFCTLNLRAMALPGASLHRNPHNCRNAQNGKQGRYLAPEERDEQFDYFSLRTCGEVHYILKSRRGDNIVALTAALGREKDGDWGEMLKSQAHSFFKTMREKNRLLMDRIASAALWTCEKTVFVGYLKRRNEQDNKKHEVVGVKEYPLNEVLDIQEQQQRCGVLDAVVKGLMEVVEPGKEYMLVKAAQEEKLKLYDCGYREKK